MIFTGRLKTATAVSTVLVAMTLGAAEPAARLSPVKDLAELTKVEAQARAGLVEAQLEMALAYDEGGLVTADHAKAAAWYALAAKQGAGVAEIRLGMMAETGDGLPQDFRQARAHYERAVELNDPEANLRLGILHLEGWGVPRDPEKAVALIRLAGEAGYHPAQIVLSGMYGVGVGTKADLREATAWAERAARDNDPEGQVAKGGLVMKNISQRDDMSLARGWFQLSAEQDYSRGMLGMAATFLKGKPSPADVQAGLRWLELAAEGGNGAAAFYLALGRTMTDRSDPAETEKLAQKWLGRAEAAGEHVAREVLDFSAQGMALREAFKQVMTVPFEDRYVQRFAAARVEAERDATDDRMPVPIKLVKPIFPTVFRLTVTDGDVLVEFVVDTQGRVREAKAVKSSHPAFAEPAVQAVQSWRFLPGRKGGRMVDTRMRVPVYFRISDVRSK
ncbi:MAG: TonB family protein [Opitutae bacterium]|nr:TonB family protein [Opitutae bacterium]